MITLSEGAKRSLESYLRQARAYLRGSKSVDADEVEQNVTEHIETELEGVPEPVSRDDLNVVLKKLGSPQQWVPAEEFPWWRLIILRLRSGPEDWRLAYMSLGFLVVGLSVVFISRAWALRTTGTSLKCGWMELFRRTNNLTFFHNVRKQL